MVKIMPAMLTQEHNTYGKIYTNTMPAYGTVSSYLLPLIAQIV